MLDMSNPLVAVDNTKARIFGFTILGRYNDGQKKKVSRRTLTPVLALLLSDTGRDAEVQFGQVL